MSVRDDEAPTMRLLLDTNLSHKLVPRLADVYPGLAHVKSFGYGSTGDPGVWALALREGFTAVVTRDRGFEAEAARASLPPPRVICLLIDGKPSIVESVMRRHRDLIVLFHRYTHMNVLELPPIRPVLPRRA